MFFWGGGGGGSLGCVSGVLRTEHIHFGTRQRIDICGRGISVRPWYGTGRTHRHSGRLLRYFRWLFHYVMIMIVESSGPFMISPPVYCKYV